MLAYVFFFFASHFFLWDGSSKKRVNDQLCWWKKEFAEIKQISRAIKYHDFEEKKVPTDGWICLIAYMHAHTYTQHFFGYSTNILSMPKHIFCRCLYLYATRICMHQQFSCWTCWLSFENIKIIFIIFGLTILFFIICTKRKIGIYVGSKCHILFWIIHSYLAETLEMINVLSENTFWICYANIFNGFI